MSHPRIRLIALTSLVLIMAAMIAGGCMSTTVTSPAGEIKKFGSPEEIRDYIRNNTQIAVSDHLKMRAVSGEMGTVRSTSKATST